MKRVLLLAVCFFLGQFGYAQTSGNLEVVGSAGEVLKSNDGSVSFTIGEISVQQMEDSINGLTFLEGFQQTYFWLVPVEEESSPDFIVKIWPNPTVRFINIELGENNDNQNIKAEIYNLLGVKIYEFFPYETKQIDLTTLAVSNYVLRIFDTESSNIQVFKITKM